VADDLVSATRAVVFDLFGTLVYEFPRADWEGWIATSAAVLEADPDMFRSAWEATAVERQTGRLGDIEQNLKTVAARAGAWPSDAQITEAMEARSTMYRKWFVPRSGAEQVLAELRSNGFALALVSMCAPDTPSMWRTSPLGGAVDVEVFSSEVGLRKPDAEIYLLACERLGVGPGECLYIGDGSYRELSGATAVGMRAVLIRDLDEQAEVLRFDADDWDGPAIADLREVPGLLSV